jgi:hypothetical protein
MTDRAELGRFGYRFWMVDGDGDRAIPREQGHAQVGTRWLPVHGSTDFAGGSLLAPYALVPWGPGWQSAGRRECGSAGMGLHGCGISAFPSMAELVRFLLRGESFPHGHVFRALPARVRQSIAVGRMETDGPWQPDFTAGAFRVPRA